MTRAYIIPSISVDDEGGERRTIAQLAEGYKALGLEPILINPSDSHGSFDSCKVINILENTYAFKEQSLIQKYFNYAIKFSSNHSSITALLLPVIFTRRSKLLAKYLKTIPNDNNIFIAINFQAAYGCYLAKKHYYAACLGDASRGYRIAYSHRNAFSPFVKRLYNSILRMEKYGYGNAINIIIRGLNSIEYVSSYLKINRYFMLYTPVDSSRIRKLPKSEALHSLGVFPEPFIIGFLGRLEESKGLDKLMEALRILKAEGNSILLLIAGSGAQEDNFKSNARRLGINVIFLGWQKDISLIYNAVDIMVFPFTGGIGISHSLCEALAYGIPVITSKFNGKEPMPNMDQVLYSDTDANSLAKAISYLIKNPRIRDQLAISAAKYYNEFHNEEKFLNDLRTLHSLQ